MKQIRSISMGKAYLKITYNQFSIKPKLNLKFDASLVKWLGKYNLQDTCTGQNLL